MAAEVEELYSNLNKLLDDICKFLTDETNYENLSPMARKHADELINRSKNQLQEIAKIKIENQGYDGEAYVDMERKSVESNEDDKNNIYSSVDETLTVGPPVQLKNPYANLPARELLQDNKYGCLSWKCKIILNFEKMRRIYAGIHDNWLLIYSSEKDSKPLHTFNLKVHNAQAVSPKQGKNLSQDFELASTFGEKKSYYFTALTHKDMLQWVAHINRSFDLLNKSDTPSISEEEISETYDNIDEVKFHENSENDEEETFYMDIETLHPDEVIKNPDKPPDLPARISVMPRTPLPSTPMVQSDQDSLWGTYDPVNIPVSVESSSFSEEEEEEAIYEEFVTKKVPEKNISFISAVSINHKRNIGTSERNSHDVEKPKLKPKILKEKPKLPILRR